MAITAPGESDAQAVFNRATSATARVDDGAAPATANATAPASTAAAEAAPTAVGAADATADDGTATPGGARLRTLCAPMGALTSERSLDVEFRQLDLELSSRASTRRRSLSRSVSSNLLSPRNRSSRTISSVETAQYALAFVGSWRQVSVTNLEGYLKHLGIPWAKRKLAGAFKPELSFAIIDGVLQVLMPSPIGERLELLPLHQEVIDVDPAGNEFIKTSRWEGSTLVTVARDMAGTTADTITRRSIRRDDGALVQTNTNAGISFERVFNRFSTKGTPPIMRGKTV